MMIFVVFISALCMRNSYHIGEVVQSVSYEPSVYLLIGPHASKC